MAGGYDGATSLYLCGKVRRIVFSWAALAQLQAKYGAEFQGEINRAMMEQDVAVLAELIAVGCGEVTAAEVMLDSPPVTAAIEAISMGLALAYNGPRLKPAESPRPLADALAGLGSAMAETLSRLRWRIGLAA